MLKWSPTNPDDMPFIDLLKSSFNHDLQRPQNEMALRNNLSELWIQIYAKAETLFSSDGASWMTSRDVQFKAILDYIRANYAATIDVPQMASAAGVSERECYRIIEACAGTTPAAYLRIPRKPCLRTFGTHPANGPDGRAPMRLCDSKPSWPGI